MEKEILIKLNKSGIITQFKDQNETEMNPKERIKK